MIVGLLLLFAQTPLSPEAQVLMEESQFLALTDEIKDYLAEHVAVVKGALPRLSALSDVIFEEQFLALSYSNDYTRNAVETFEERTGNCLSFTAMFVAMAREVGLEAYFQEVELAPTWDRKGHVSVLMRHINALILIDGKVFIMDFNPFSGSKVRINRPVTDERALAHYYNNRGAEHYGAGEYESALANFLKAVQVDQTLSYAWSGAGLSQNRLGRFQEAERTLIKATQVNKRDMVAMNNLVAFYTGHDRLEEAGALERRVQKHRARNPFYHYYLANRAINEEDWEAVVKHLKNAIRLKRKQHDFHALLADTYLRMGKTDRARRHLNKALRYAPLELQATIYRERLNQLELYRVSLESKGEN
ncbi:MAG: tetratricopeptide repeat protein [Acidobacteriota bacterium]|nr:tetratricopeptide repeat protein [Acidobacteriota bacterium]